MEDSVVDAISHNVTLFRISSSSIPTMHHDSLLHFNVDSTIYKLIIIAQGSSNISPPRVLNPAAINNGLEVHRKFSRRELKTGPRLTMPTQGHNLFNSSNESDAPEQMSLGDRRGPVARTHEIFQAKGSHLSGNIRARSKIDNSGISNKPGGRRLSVDQPDVVTSGRRIRSAVMYQVDPDANQWEIDMPESGTWSIDTAGQDSRNITVQAFTDLDFEFEFLDYSLQKLDLPPIARDPCIVSIRMTSPTCLYNLTGVDLYDDLGEVKDSAALSNPNLDAAQQTTGRSDPVTAQAVFSAPAVPFFLCLRGYDVTGLPFQRLSSLRVVPRMFAISIHQNISARPPFSSDRNETVTLWLRNADLDATFKVSARFDSEKSLDNDGETDISNLGGRGGRRTGDDVVIAVITLQAVDVSSPLRIFCLGEGQAACTEGAPESLPAHRGHHHSQSRAAVPDHHWGAFMLGLWCLWLTSSTGGCRQGQACQLQEWGVQVSVADNMTGVASAGFINTPSGAYTNVQISSMGISETASAEYRFTCCNTMAVLMVKDNSGNEQRCRFQAPKLDPLPADTTTVGSQRSSGGAIRISSTVSMVTHPGTHGLGFLFPILQYGPIKDSSHNGVSTSGSTVAVMVSSLAGERDATTQGAESSPAVSGQGPVNIVRSKTESWDDQKYVSFKRDAIVIGSVAGTAGLTIVLVCVAYRIVHRKNGSGRSGSESSDITMGGSWEARSESPSGSGSIRSAASTRSQPVDIEMDSRVPDRTISRTNAPCVGNRKLDRAMIRHDHATVLETPMVRNLPPERLGKKVEDVIFRCVVVKDIDRGVGGVSARDEKKNMREDDAGESYRAMIEVQKRLIAMNQRMKRLAEEASGRIDRPESSPHLVLVRPYREHTDTPPPGSPTPGAVTSRAVTPRVSRHRACCANEVDIDTERLSGRSQRAAQSIGGDGIVALRDGDGNSCIVGDDGLDRSSRQNPSNINSTGQLRTDRHFVSRNSESENSSQYCNLKKILDIKDIREKTCDNLTRSPVQTHSACVHRPNQSLTLPTIRFSERKRSGYLTPELRRHVLEQNFQADVRRSSAPEAMSTDGPMAHGDKSTHSLRQIDSGTAAVVVAERHPDMRLGGDSNVWTNDPTLVGHFPSPHANESGPREYMNDIVGASQLELRQDLRRVRDKLYQFQKRIDRELEAQGRNRSDSGDSSTSGSGEENEDR
ncbi:hypothetical protein Btru_057372 [Bulinus truncatus]|nr:hypothetical protein Btru_057372 [Bulinus truncatus]